MSNIVVVNIVFLVLVVAGIGGLLIAPPLLSKIDRVGNIGFMGW